MTTLLAPTDTTPPGVWIVGGVYIFDRADAETASRAMRQPMRRVRPPAPAPAPQRSRVRSRHRPRNRARRRNAPTRGSPDDPDPDGHRDARRKPDEPPIASAALANIRDLRKRTIDGCTDQVRPIIRKAVLSLEGETVGLPTAVVLAAVFGLIPVGVER